MMGVVPRVGILKEFAVDPISIRPGGLTRLTPATSRIRRMSLTWVVFLLKGLLNMVVSSQVIWSLRIFLVWSLRIFLPKSGEMLADSSVNYKRRDSGPKTPVDGWILVEQGCRSIGVDDAEDRQVASCGRLVARKMSNRQDENRKPPVESYQALALQVTCVAVNALDDAQVRERMAETLDRLERQIAASKAFIGPDLRLVVRRSTS